MPDDTRELERIIARHGRRFDRFQHIDLYRKLLVRKRMLKWALPGPAYVPFIGDGDIAARLYTDRLILGADIEESRVSAAQAQLEPLIAPDIAPHIVAADCNAWPFPHYRGRPFAIADIDPYGAPFDALRAFWENAEKARRVVLFVTDGARLDLIRKSRLHHPDGQVIKLGRFETTKAFNTYWSKIVLPWLIEYVKPYRVVTQMRYQRNVMLYWSVVLDAPKRRRAVSRRTPARPVLVRSEHESD